ncbi:MAG: hypothetical protein PHQ35_09785 [Phycisphaerae bacterium]|nr:hypothetical protein [Phycisphaerae bacterium]
MAISASMQKLLDTGKYELYTKANGQQDIRLKQAYQTTNVTPVKAATISPVNTAVTNAVKTATNTVKTGTTGTTGANVTAGVKTASTGTAGTATTGTGTSGTTSTDTTIQGYKDQYATAQKSGDKVGMLKAAEAADKYRVSIGQTAQNTTLITSLKNKLTDEEKLKYTSGQSEDISGKVLNFDETYTPETTKEEYMSEITTYINSLLKQQADESAANTAKSRNTLLSDADIAKQELDDTYNQQLAELASQADKIRAAYTTGKANIETTQAKTLPTYDTSMNQQDILAQKQAKQIGEEFAQRGLQAGGQVTSELGQAAQTNLSEVGKIATSKQNYIADVANDLAALETDQATGLADTARAQSTAAQTLSSGKSAIIKKVNAALSNLTVDETTLLNSLAEQRTQMLYDATSEYRELSRQEKNDAFNQLLQQAGVAADSVDTIRQLIDDKTEADMAALEYKTAELKYKNLSKELELERQSLEQDIKGKKIDNATASLEYNNLKKGLNRDGSTPKSDEETPSKNEMTASFEAQLDKLTTNAQKLAYITKMKTDIITYLGKSAYDAYVKDFSE